MLEYFFTCPYCWETISMLLDSGVPSQQYIEDCEVWCNPIEVIVNFNNGKLTHFQANKN
ncbi:CPXCG motif-containing cysteine-rich protein [Formosa sp. S-31]|uniref:CPXCG motif-containing cysteine-rich protein n=1 Tax=Formosa sp. S-31 TaxID=2790949 RepID=UPI003EBAEB1B